MLISTLYQSKVSNDLVNHFNEIFDLSVKSSFLEDTSELCTYGGTQTKNVSSIIDPLSYKELYSVINAYIDLYYRYTLDSYNYLIDHIHIIDYQPGGYQEKHTHHYMEDHSFIVCLNDSDGKTRFYINEEPLDIDCIKNKIYLFNAAFFHEGLKCTTPRRIAVGSIRFTHKVWKPRY